MQSNVVLTALAQGRPNILVLSIENTSWCEFVSYGNKCIEAPNIERLSNDGMIFKYAYSNASPNSPARSQLIAGTYASTFAMEQYRSNPATLPNLLCSQLLRYTGYCCTHNAKTDYNTTMDNISCWDECYNKNSYNSTVCPVGKFLFTVFNIGVIHMGRVRLRSDGHCKYIRRFISYK